MLPRAIDESGLQTFIQRRSNLWRVITFWTKIVEFIQDWSNLLTSNRRARYSTIIQVQLVHHWHGGRLLFWSTTADSDLQSQSNGAQSSNKGTDFSSGTSGYGQTTNSQHLCLHHQHRQPNHPNQVLLRHHQQPLLPVPFQEQKLRPALIPHQAPALIQRQADHQCHRQHHPSHQNQPKVQEEGSDCIRTWTTGNYSWDETSF